MCVFPGKYIDKIKVIKNISVVTYLLNDQESLFRTHIHNEYDISYVIGPLTIPSAFGKPYFPFPSPIGKV